MTSDYFLGVDIGTYESKGVITDGSGKIVSQAAIQHGLSLPKPGWAEHDAEAIWWHDFRWLVHQLLTQGGLAAADITAIGCSGIGPDLLPLDENGKPLRPAILYGIDTRASAEIAELEAKYGEEVLLAQTGNSLSSQSVGPKILWLARHEPEVFRHTAHILTATGYLVFRLTGKAYIDHYTAATFAPLYHLERLGWDEKMCVGIVDPAVLPQPAWSGEVAGGVTPEAAALTGLHAGTPVVVGTTDAAAEAISVGVTEPGELMIMYGSTLFLIHVVDRLLVDPRLWAGVFLTPQKWALAAGMATAGSLTRWFRDQFAPVEMTDEAKGGPNAYAALSQLAGEIPPGSQGLIILPYFSGERTPIQDPEARGAVLGLTLSHTRAHVYRAVLEGVAYGIAHNLETMAAAGGVTRQATAVGGGTHSRLWLEIVSAVTGVDQVIPSQTIGAAYGDAFLAALGVGRFQALGEVKSWVQIAEIIHPNPAWQEVYPSYYQTYRAIYPSIKDHLHVLANLGRRGTT